MTVEAAVGAGDLAARRLAQAQALAVAHRLRAQQDVLRVRVDVARTHLRRGLEAAGGEDRRAGMHGDLPVRVSGACADHRAGRIADQLHRFGLQHHMSARLLDQRLAAAQMLDDVDLIAVAVEHVHLRRHRDLAPAQPGDCVRIGGADHRAQIGIAAAVQRHPLWRGGGPHHPSGQHRRSADRRSLLHHDHPGAALGRPTGCRQARHAGADDQKVALDDLLVVHFLSSRLRFEAAFRPRGTPTARVGALVARLPIPADGLPAPFPRFLRKIPTDRSAVNGLTAD